MNKSVATHSLYEVKYVNNTFIALGDMGEIVTSLDGVQWRNANSPTSTYLKGIGYGNGIYVIVGQSGTIITSPDGVSWQTRTSGVSVRLTGVAYGNGTFVAVGDSGIILTSSDAVNWKPRTSGSFPNLTGIAYGNGTFVALGAGNAAASVLSSDDGVHWTSQSVSLYGNIGDIMFVNGSFAFVNYNSIMTSKDGMQWSSAQVYPSEPSHKFDYGLHSITYAKGSLFVVGDGNRFQSGSIVFSSSDGTVWQVADGVIPFGFNLAYGNGAFVAVSGTSIFSSTDLLNWTTTNLMDVKPIFLPISTFSDIAYVNSTFIARGIGNAINLTSTDGMTWKINFQNSNNSPRSVSFCNGKFIGWRYHAFYISVDGSNWVATPLNPQTLDLYQVACGNGKLVGLSRTYANDSTAVLVSSDGLTWSTVNLGYPVPEDIVFGNGIFVSIGRHGTIITSSNGTNWTLANSGTTNDLIKVTFGNNTFVALGSAQTGQITPIFTSQNGTDWTAVNTGVPSLLDWVTYGGGYFVAVGDGIMTSTDSKNWVARNSGITERLSKVIYASGTFVAIAPHATPGSESRLYQSGDVR